MLSMLGTLFGSIFGGGVTGLLGVAVQRYFDLQNKKQDQSAALAKYAHEIDMRNADAEVMAQEWAGKTQVAQIEETGHESVADAQAFQASFAMEPQRYSEKVVPTAGQGWALVLLDFFRGVIRPGLTVYLCAVTTLIYFHSQKLMAATIFTPDQAMALNHLIVGTILYLTTTCTLHWFGTRDKQKAPDLGK